MVAYSVARLLSVLALAGVSTVAAAQLTRMQGVKPLPVTPPALTRMINPVTYADLPIIVGATGGYVLRLEGMTTDGLTELGSGYRIGRESTGPAVAVGPNATIYSLVPGNGATQFQLLPEPHWQPAGGSGTSIASDANAMYGVDSQAGQIWRYDYATKAVQTFGTKGNGPGQFEMAEQIAVDPQGRIYVADHNRIVRIDDISGTGWATFGKPGGGQGEFSYITGLAVDSKSRIYAVDIFNGRLVKIDNMLGDGWEEMRFHKPNCVATDARDRVYVCESERWTLTRLDNMAGAGRKELKFVRSDDWRYGSFGHVAVMKPTPRGNDVIR